jgi:hypothetical protein
MTTLTRAGQPAQPLGATRVTAVLANLGATFKHWAAVRRELGEISRSGDLSVRARRLMRPYY